MSRKMISISSCASWIRIKSQDFIVSNYLWAIWILKLNIFQEHKSDKSHALQRNCWVGQHVCWQHDIFVGSDVMAHKRFFYLPCYCKERRHLKLLWQRKSFAGIRRWKERIFRRARGMWWGAVGHRSITDSGFNFFSFFSLPVKRINMSKQEV